MQIDIRKLIESDAEAYREIRIRSLREHPEAYVMSAAEAEEISIADYAERIAQADSVNLGAFVDGRLKGITGLYRSNRKKARQRVHIVGVYVAPEARRQGLARRLLDMALSYARRMEQVTDVVLGVTAGNESAKQLYLKAGFHVYAVDPRYIRVGDTYHDLEWMLLSIRSDGISSDGSTETG